MAIDTQEIYTPSLDLRARHMTRRLVSLAFSTLLLGGAAPLAHAAPPAPPISGVVRHQQAPVAGVLVIAYNLGDSSLARMRTATDGTFVLASAPAGVYDLIAYKRGFEPAIERLWHQATADQVSAVSIALTKKGGDMPAPVEPVTMWDLRDRLPTDVLRELGIDPSPDQASKEAAAAPQPTIPVSRLLAGEVQTMTDVSAASTSALSRAAVGLHGGLPNGWQYGINGDYSALGGQVEEGETTGNAAGLALDVAPSAAEKVRLSTRRNTLVLRRRPREPPVARRLLEPRRRGGPRRVGRRALHRGNQPVPRDRPRHDDLPARLPHVGSQRAVRARRDGHAGRVGRDDLPSQRRDRGPLGRRRRRSLLPVGARRGPRRRHLRQGHGQDAAPGRSRRALHGQRHVVLRDRSRRRARATTSAPLPSTSAACTAWPARPPIRR